VIPQWCLQETMLKASECDLDEQCQGQTERQQDEQTTDRFEMMAECDHDDDDDDDVRVDDAGDVSTHVQLVSSRFSCSTDVRLINEAPPKLPLNSQ